ncbi:MAG: hypothetical protein WAX85_00320 [Minisyncoccia bacterium]
MSTPDEQKLRTEVKEKEDKPPLSVEDRQKLVGAFAWLIQEDKKQNPELSMTSLQCKVP